MSCIVLCFFCALYCCQCPSSHWR